MKTVLKFGKIAYEGKKKTNLVEVSIELRNKEKVNEWETFKELTNVPELSICGQVWDSEHYDHLCGGQCLDTLKELLPNNKKLGRIVEIWDEYHLNDMNAGSKRQTEFLNNLKATGWKYDYTDACNKLKEAGLYMDNGYSYGHGWLYCSIPENVLNEIKELISN